jgi:hypothetical protein
MGFLLVINRVLVFVENEERCLILLLFLKITSMFRKFETIGLSGKFCFEEFLFCGCS